MDSMYATSIWCSQIWVPAPARSLGFAIGPFKILEDAEYFSAEEADDEEEKEEEDDDDEQPEEEEKDLVEAARKNGEGIRQVYVAPLWERKHLLLYPVNNHSGSANLSLSQVVDIQLQPLTSSQVQFCHDLEQTLQGATVGVPHRALSLTRDILALPSYRTASYTQIWIPNAVHGGVTSGALHGCPEVQLNPFLGGSLLDARLLPPLQRRLPHHAGGRVLQLVQARAAVRGWIVAALPLGNDDDVGYGYIHSLIESSLMSFYERGHGAYGEGGAKGSMFYSQRRTVRSGLNSPNLDFLPIVNVELLDQQLTSEESQTTSLWRSPINGTESFSSGQDESTVRQVLCGDIVEVLERGTSQEGVPLPSFGWTGGSHLSLSFLSSTATSSSDLGCGAVELAHPVGGLLYRTLKGNVVRRVMEGRAGTSNLVRLLRAGFLAGYLGDLGQEQLNWEQFVVNPKKNKNEKEAAAAAGNAATATTTSTETNKPKDKTTTAAAAAAIRPPFVICVDKLLSTGGFTHTLFTSGLRLLAGPMKEAHLRGTLVDVERNVRSTSTNRQFVEPEGFPNSYIRGASMPYLRIGTHVEMESSSTSSKESAAAGGAGSGNKGPQLQVLVEPATPDGGIVFGGPMTLRVIENEGQVREVMKLLNTGTRSDWGPLFLHTKPVTTAKEQANASGVIEPAASSSNTTSSSGTSTPAKGEGKGMEGGDATSSSGGADNKTNAAKDASPAKEENNILLKTHHHEQDDMNVFDAHTLANTNTPDNVFYDENMLHIDGFQAIELLRLTNLTPLLWIRVDPHCHYGGKLSVVQPDSCYAEQLFHDGDASAQVEAIRAMAERPLKLQQHSSQSSSHQNTNVLHNVHISELPIRLLGDCLRGSPALHGDLPHTPVVRCQAALGMAQWQNNKAPPTHQQYNQSSQHWLGLNLLLQYFKERYYQQGIVTPVKFQRLAVKKSKTGTVETSMNGTKGKRALDDFEYLDTTTSSSTKETAAATADADSGEPSTSSGKNNKSSSSTKGSNKKKKDKNSNSNKSTTTTTTSTETNDTVEDDTEVAEWEEDEEYRVRSAVITAIASVRAKDGVTPSVVLKFLRTVLDAGDDVSLVDNSSSSSTAEPQGANQDVAAVSKFSYVPSMVIADVLLACCSIHATPDTITDPKTGETVQKPNTPHPALPLLLASRQWLEWELYRESIREETMKAHSGSSFIIGGNCYDSVLACGIAAVSTLGILCQTTTDYDDSSEKKKEEDNVQVVTSMSFYQTMLERDARSDVTKAACAQAIACVCCAADRFETTTSTTASDSKSPPPPPLGLLTALEYLLKQIIHPDSSPGYRQTLALLMMDTCTGKVSNLQRVAVVGGTSDLLLAGTRFYGGPLGASHGCDNGSACLLTVSQQDNPVANAVNDGARRGLRWLSRAGHSRDTTSTDAVVTRAARFATDLWRTLNGHDIVHNNNNNNVEGDGVCAHDGILRCSLLALWQWIWPKACYAILKVQSWRNHEDTPRYKSLGADQVLKVYPEETSASEAEEQAMEPLMKCVNMELDRQLWRGEMVTKAYEYNADTSSTSQTSQTAEEPYMPPILRDAAFKSGGWVTSTSRQRRQLQLDGGVAVTKIRASVKGPE